MRSSDALGLAFGLAMTATIGCMGWSGGSIKHGMHISEGIYLGER